MLCLKVIVSIEPDSSQWRCWSWAMRLAAKLLWCFVPWHILSDGGQPSSAPRILAQLHHQLWSVGVQCIIPARSKRDKNWRFLCEGWTSNRGTWWWEKPRDGTGELLEGQSNPPTVPKATLQFLFANSYTLEVGPMEWILSVIERISNM